MTSKNLETENEIENKIGDAKKKRLYQIDSPEN